MSVINPVDKSRQMTPDAAIDALAALAQPTRLEAFRLLMRQEPDGLPAGEIARRLDVPHNTLSTHLGILSRAGLVSAVRHSRNLIYRAELATVRQLVLFMLKDCCNGRPELCAPLIDDIATSCAPSGACCCERPGSRTISRASSCSVLRPAPQDTIRRAGCNREA